jgi:hypothetical protein
MTARGCFPVARGSRLLLGLRQACAARGDAPDFSGLEQDSTSNANGLEFSGSLQPKKRRFADFQKRKNLSARKQTRTNRLLGDVCGGQVPSPFQNAPKVGATEGSYTRFR